MSKRFVLLGGPGGYLNCLPIGDPQLNDQYRTWTRLITVNRPLTPSRAGEAKDWALRMLRRGHFALVTSH